MSDHRGIVLQQTNFVIAPMLICDGCGEVIRDYHLACVMWDDKLKNGQTVRPKIVCKARMNGCYTKGEYLGFESMELGDFIINLCRNLGMRTKEDFCEAFDFAELIGRI
jgi:hypothetical protein